MIGVMMKVISGEHIVEMVLERVIDVSKLLCIDVDYFYSSDNSGLEKRLKDPDKYWIPIEMFITDEFAKWEQKTHRVFNQKDNYII